MSVPATVDDFEFVKEDKADEINNGLHGLILKRLDHLEQKIKSDVDELIKHIGDMKKG